MPTASVGSIFERSQESGTSADVSGGTEASAAWDSGLLDESGVSVDVVAMMGASAACALLCFHLLPGFISFRRDKLLGWHLISDVLDDGGPFG